MEWLQAMSVSNLQQPEWRVEVACNIDRESIGEPLLEEGSRYFDGFGSRDDLGDQGICLSLGHTLAHPGIGDANLHLYQQRRQRKAAPSLGEREQALRACAIAQRSQDAAG